MACKSLCMCLALLLALNCGLNEAESENGLSLANALGMDAPSSIDSKEEITTEEDIQKTLKQFTDALSYLKNDHNMTVTEKHMVGSVLYRLVMVKLRENELEQAKRVQQQMEEQKRLEASREAHRLKESAILRGYLGHSAGAFLNDFHTLRY